MKHKYTILSMLMTCLVAETRESSERMLHSLDGTCTDMGLTMHMQLRPVLMSSDSEPVEEF